MPTYNHYNPVKIRVGAGQLSTLPDLLSPGLWLLVTTDGFNRRGLTTHIEALTPQTDWEVYHRVTPNPELDHLEDVITQYRQTNIQGVVAVGGGSVIDAAKVLAVTLPSPLQRPLHTVLRQGQKHHWQGQLPLIAIPTTSGTGAEVTPFATVWDATTHKKYSIVGDQVFPKMALLDPELILSLPPKQTLYTGLDAISHCLESLWNHNQTPISVAYATQGLNLALNSLPQVLDSPQNLQARAQMQQASLLAGLAISQTRTAIAHSMSYPLTSHFDVPHGLACSFTLPNIIEYYIKNCNCLQQVTLMQQIQKMLNQLNLFQHLHEYATDEQILTLKAEMFHPERAGNFQGVLNDDIVEAFLTEPT
ncbi:alcohol dehydrogenase [Limnospira fusiformis CCALA 023]|nr:phosphonoacetaldehyde reductase [Arthrospira platensis NCB002]BAI87870.1 alcohol dehydrogenase [Arthrospira platensis NIES-39]